MNRASVMKQIKTHLLMGTLVLGAAFSVSAQTPATPAAAAEPKAAAPEASKAGAMGVQSANIFSIAPDANTDPKYADQNNGERDKVQPGNNAPMWRQV
ncbi:MAG: Formate dehydrogenase, cytochrome b556(fdo) subunit, partial [Pseudomonadota bacterium]